MSAKSQMTGRGLFPDSHEKVWGSEELMWGARRRGQGGMGHGVEGGRGERECEKARLCRIAAAFSRSVGWPLRQGRPGGQTDRPDSGR